MPFLAKKRRLRQTASRRKMVLSKKHHFGPKKGACGKPPAEENCLFPKETLFLCKKRRLRQAASRRGNMLVKFLGLFFFPFQFSSRTWGINFDTIACPLSRFTVQNKTFFPTKIRLFDFFQNDLGIKNFLANRPFLIRKKYSRRLKPSYLIFFFRHFFGKFQNDLGIKNFLANRPSLIRKKYSRRPKPSYLQFFFFRDFFENFQKNR